MNCFKILATAITLCFCFLTTTRSADYSSDIYNIITNQSLSIYYDCEIRSPYKTNSLIAVRSKTNYFVREDNTRQELLRTSFSGNTKIGGLNSGQYWHYQLEGLTLRITDGLNINGQNSWIPKAIIITCQSKCENGYRAMFCGLMSCNVA